MDIEQMGAIIHRMMRDRDDDNHEPNRKPRCEGCGARVPLQPYQLGDGGLWLMYCAQCRALAEIVNLDEE
jgi:hypothetical protein